MANIFLSNGVKFETSEGQTILDAAIQSNIAIEHSCRNGRCGICAAPVLQGETEPVSPEESLGKTGEAEGSILTCCRVALSDVHLAVADLGAIGRLPLVTLPCRIDSIDLLTSDVIALRLRVPPSADFIFFPGQYLDLIHDGFRRSYSIANAARSDNKLELQVKKVDGGKMSDYLFSQASPNDLLRLEGPRGTFSYREDDSKNLVFMATGTGIAPIKAILEDFGSRDIKKNVYVVWGGRVSSDLYLDTTTMSARHVFIPVLSREEKSGAFFGYVQGAVLSLGLDLNSTTVYACGSENMIRDAMDILVKSGLSSKRFYSDAFVSTN